MVLLFLPTCVQNAPINPPAFAGGFFHAFPTEPDMDTNATSALVRPLDDELWTVEQTCVFTGMSFDAFKKRLKAGDGPAAVYIGPSQRFLKSDVIAWLRTMRASA
jgi:predicted DNA-binding transcriptional regulator AlpA